MSNNRLLSPIRAIIREFPELLGLLRHETVKAIYSNYPILRAEFFATVYDAVEIYLTSARPFTAFKNAMNRIIATGFLEAAEIGYEQGGASLPFDSDTQAWLATRIDQEMGYVQSLFNRLSRDKEGANAQQEAFDRATGYTKTLDAVYGEAKLRARDNIMVRWVLGFTEEHCVTKVVNGAKRLGCMQLAGQRHRAKWFISRGLIPRRPGAAQTCGGYECQCKLVGDNGVEYVIE